MELLKNISDTPEMLEYNGISSMKPVYIPLIFCLFLALAFGCATSKGSLFTDVVNREESEQEQQKTGSTPGVAETDPIKEDDIEEGKQAGLYIRTFPQKAEVFINGAYFGRSPLLIPDLGSGSYRLSAVYPGFYPEETWVTYKKGTRLELDFYLTAITGFLAVGVDQAGAMVYIDGEERGTGLHELPVGRHSIRVRKFGFDDYRGTVLVAENRTVSVDVSLTESVFEVTDLHTSKTILNPENPGKLGEVDIVFNVSSYGTGELSIYNQQKELLFSHTFTDFTTWSQSFSWDGTDTSGTVLPDGEYAIEVAGSGSDDSVSSVKSAVISISRKAVIRYRGLTSGISGFLYCATPEVLPKGSFQMSFLTLGHYDPSTTPVTYRFPLHLGFRITPLKNLEINAQSTLYLQSGEKNPFSIGAAGKYQFLKTSGIVSVSGGVTGKGTLLWNDTADSLTNYSGFSLGVPFLVSFGPVGVSVTPELTISGTRVFYSSESTSGLSSPPYIWGYGRAAVFADIGAFTAGLSTAFRTKPFAEGFGIHLPAALGGELHVLIPGTQLLVSLGLGMELSSVSNFYIMAGGGLGIIN